MVQGRLLQGKKHVFLAMYPEYQNLNIAPPPLVEHLFQRCARILYKSRTEGLKTDKENAINLFLLTDNTYYDYIKKTLPDYFKERNSVENLHINNVTDLLRIESLQNKEKQEQIAKKYGIRFFIQEEYKELIPEIVETETVDVLRFFKTRAKPLNQNNETYTKIVDQVLEKTVIQTLKNARIEQGTKSQVHGFCIQDLTIEFTIGCRSYSEILNIPKLGETYVFNPWLGCVYCYNRWVNIHDFAHGIHPADKKELIEQIAKLEKQAQEENRTLRTIRIGPGTEAFNPELMPHVMTTIEAATKKEKNVILPTKTPYFDTSIAKFLKRHKTRLMISFGRDEWEIGVYRQGFENEKRLELAQQYHAAGVKTVLYPLVDITTPPFEQKGFKTAERVYKLSQEKGIPIQFLLFRTNNRALLSQVTDREIRGRIHPDQKSFFEFTDNVYFLHNNEKDYVPRVTHPFYIELIDKRNPMMGVCSVSPLESLCTNCFVNQGKKRMGRFQKTPLKESDEVKQERYQRAEKLRRKQYLQNHIDQKKLFPEVFKNEPRRKKHKRKKKSIRKKSDLKNDNS